MDFPRRAGVNGLGSLPRREVNKLRRVRMPGRSELDLYRWGGYWASILVRIFLRSSSLMFVA